MEGVCGQKTAEIAKISDLKSLWSSGLIQAKYPTE